MRYAYYGNYATYYEVGRVEALRQLGMTYRELEDSGLMMPVLNSKSVFHKPAKYDEELNIEVRVVEMPSTRIKFEYRIFNEAEVLIHSGETTLAFVNKHTGKPEKAPTKMTDLLAPFFNE